MMKLTHRRSKGGGQEQNRTGAALVEAALILPIFFVVILGIVEFGRAMMVGQMMTNATREAVRMATIDGTTNADVTNHVVDQLSTSIGVAADQITVTVLIDEADGNPPSDNQIPSSSSRDLITVRTEVPFVSIAYVTPSYLTTGNLTSEAAMRRE